MTSLVSLAYRSSTGSREETEGQSGERRRVFFFCGLQEIWHGVDRSTFISGPFIRGDVTDFCTLSHTGVCSDMEVQLDVGVEGHSHTHLLTSETADD